jgi:hypothetical protein
VNGASLISAGKNLNCLIIKKKWLDLILEGTKTVKVSISILIVSILIVVAASDVDGNQRSLVWTIVTNVGYSIVAASIFNIFLIDLPKAKTANRVNTVVGPLTHLIIDRTNALLTFMNHAANPNTYITQAVDFSICPKDLETLLGGVNPNSNVPAMTSGAGPVTWQRYLASYNQEIGEFYREIVALSAYLDSEHLELLGEIKFSNFLRQVYLYAGAPIANGDMKHFKNELLTLFESANKLKQYANVNLSRYKNFGSRSRNT